MDPHLHITVHIERTCIKRTPLKPANTADSHCSLLLRLQQRQRMLRIDFIPNL